MAAQSHLNLPRTPDSFAHHFIMNAAIPSIRPADILSWTTWRKQISTPVTPPMTSTVQSRIPATAPSIQTQTEVEMDEESESEMDDDEYEQAPSRPEDEASLTLPPIAHLERHIHNLPPLTPPDDIPQYQTASRISLPKIATTHSDTQFFEEKQSMHQYGAEVSSSSSLYPTSTHLFPPASSHRHQPPSNDAPEPQGITPNTSAAAATTISTLALAPAPPSYLVDWLDFTRTRSAHFIAEKTCEMICYLWFSIPSHAKSYTSKPLDGSPVLEDASSLSKSTGNSVTTLQLIATPAFVTFMQKLLETTQVSQSVIVLSLHYIHRLKEKNRYMPAQPGSEFRIAVAGLMMANKFLDDNTYTNKTWSEVSGISLNEINRMEVEFLLGVDFNLYVDKTTYASWLNLLKGLVLAKERDARRLLRGSSGRGANSARRAAAAVAASSMRGGRDRDGKFWHPHHPPAHHHSHVAQTSSHHPHSYARPHQVAPAHSSTGPASRTYTTPAAATNAINAASSSSSLHTRSYRHRARSTSPQFTFSSNATSSNRAISHSTAYPPHNAQEQNAYNQQYYRNADAPTHLHTPLSPTPSTLPPSTEVAPSAGSKRSAAAAFSSPKSPLQNSVNTSRRPTSVYSTLHNLQIPDYHSASRPATGSASAGINNSSPLDGLHDFGNMNLGVASADGLDNELGRRSDRVDEPNTDTRQAKRVKAEPRPTMTTSSANTIAPQTLVAAYSADAARNAALPKNLFFYTLASSPSAEEKERERQEASRQQRERSMEPSDTSMESDDVPYAYSESKARKTRLRYQAAQPVKHGYDYADLNAFNARGAPLYSDMQQTLKQVHPQSVHTTTTTPISPVPALVPARPMRGPFVSSPSTHLQQGHVFPVSTKPSLVHPRAQHLQSALSAQTTPVAGQSACSSPETSTTSNAGNGVQHLPHFHDDVWAAPPRPAQVKDQDPAEPHWPTSRQNRIDYIESSPTAPNNPSTSRHQFASSSHPHPPPGSTHSSPFRHCDVPSAPFANAGPPGFVTQFYSTPEVQQVHMPSQMFSAYATYSAYGPNVAGTGSALMPSSSAGFHGSVTGVVSGGTPVATQTPQGFAIPHGEISRQTASGSQTGYTYSGAHSTSNSPYHSAAMSRYGDFTPYPAHTASNSTAYARY